MTIEVSTVVGPVRWMQKEHERKLQQLYAIRTYRDGKAVSECLEWRDVPDMAICAEEEVP